MGTKPMNQKLNDYLKMCDHESQFIYALDKLLPIINIELNNHNFYYTSKTTYEDMLRVKEAKIKTDPIVYKYFVLLTKYLRDEAKFFWPANSERDYSDKFHYSNNAQIK